MDSFCFSPSDFHYKTLSPHFFLQILFKQLLIRVLFRLSFAAMNSNRKSTSEKPKGVETDSSPGPIKLIGTPYVSLDHSISNPHSKQAKGEASVTSGLTKLSGKTSVSSGILIGVPKSRNPNGMKTGVSSGVRGKAVVSSGAKGKAIVSTEVVAFKGVKYGAPDGELRFRLIHFWEVRNVVTKVLLGLEMLLIDQEEAVVQGFIPAGRIDTYLPHIRAGGIYRLNSFFGSNNKTLYRVTDPKDSSACFPEDRFRFHGYEEFDAACDFRGDLYDYVGHIKLVNRQVLSDTLVLDDAEIASSRRVLLHVQTHDDPVMKLYLWDKAASNFSERFKASGGTARVILVTTLNPKRLGGALALSSMTPSRVFLDTDVQATRDYLTWMNTDLDVANRVDADIVTKTETVTIGELFSYMKQEDAKVVQYQLATKGPTSLMCKKCGKPEIAGVAQYLAKIFVYDNDDQASFLLLGGAGYELSGKKASELVEDYFEANEDVGDDHLVPVPQALIDTIGQTRKFVVKVSNHNLTGQTQALTVTKVLTPEVPEVEANLEGNVAVPDAQETLDKEVAGDGPSTFFVSVKRVAGQADAEDPKRAGNG
ncbi:BnaC09g37970D [Brassica napus]|uniref:BnaC09g37970D protein n=1 Tax=Brassica napus TaxID=3708 RepID=A0A078HBT4_BRANA|nr:BnaC09g37970D [Brassica napus]